MATRYADPYDPNQYDDEEQQRQAMLNELEQPYEDPNSNRGTADPVNTAYNAGSQTTDYNQDLAALNQPTQTHTQTQTNTGSSWTNPAASNDPNSAQYAPRIIQQNGQSYLTEHGNRRLLQGNELTDAQKYVDDFWGQYSTGFQPGVGPQSNQQQTELTQSSWDTDGYSKPQYTAGSYGGVMAGWDAGNWDNKDMQTPKYAVGRILSNYPASPNGLKAAMADIQKAYPGAEQIGFDKISIPGVGVIDVGGNFDPNNPDAVTNWWWGDQSQVSDSGSGGGGTPIIDPITNPNPGEVPGGGGGGGGNGGGGGGGYTPPPPTAFTGTPTYESGNITTPEFGAADIPVPTNYESAAISAPQSQVQDVATPDLTPQTYSSTYNPTSVATDLPTYRDYQAPTVEATAAPIDDTVTNTFRDAIIKNLMNLQNVTTAEDPSIKAVTDAYRLNSQRGLQDTRTALAEQAYAEGQMGSGGYDDMQQRALERAAMNEATFTGNVMNEREKQRQQLLASTIDSGNQLGVQNRTLDLQNRTLDQNAKQFAARLGYDYDALNAEDRRFIDELTQNAKQFDEQSRQFGSDQQRQYDAMNQQGQQFSQNLGLEYAGLNQRGQIARDDLGARYAGINADLAKTRDSLNAQYAGMNQSNQQFKDELAAKYAGMNQTGQLARDNMNLNYAQLGQAGRQFDAQLNQDASQFAAELGYKYDALNTQDKQFFRSLAEQARQANMQNNLGWAGLNQNGQIAANNLRFNYDQLDQTSALTRDSIIASILNGGGAWG